MTLPVFYYANGTSWLWNYAGVTWQQDFAGGTVFGQPIGAISVPDPIYVKGLDGQNFLWEGGIPNDPFPRLLNTELWTYQRVPYPAQMVFMGPSIEIGVDWVVNQILNTPSGTPFALGGYSQGAAVMSRVYNECRQGRLVSRRADLRAVVTFGNPMREVNHTYPGSSGFSGACDIAGSTTGGHGTFPALTDIPFANFGDLERFVTRFARLQNTEDLFWDFTMPNEVISGVGGSNVGQFLVDWTMYGLQQFPIAALFSLPQAFAYWEQLGKAPAGVLQNTVTQVVKIIDAVTGAIRDQPGGGHIMYPFYPPPNADGSIPTSGDTCYQLAAKYLNGVGEVIYNERNPSVPVPTVRPYSWFTSLPGE